MRYLLWLIALAALAVSVTFIPYLNTGYVILVVPPYRIDLSINLFIVYLAASAVVLYLLGKLIAGMIALPEKVRRWRARRKQVEARKQGYLAMVALIEGRAQQAEERVDRALKYEKDAHARLVVALTGAKAAHSRGDVAQRERYLHAVENKDNKLSIAAALLEAEMLSDDQHDHEALHILTRVRKLAPKLIAAMRLELRIRQRLGHTVHVLSLLDKLEKAAVLDHQTADRIRNEAYLQQLAMIADRKALTTWWGKLPGSAQGYPAIALAAAKSLVAFDDKAAAAVLLETTLNDRWDPTLLDCYSCLGLAGSELSRQLETSETWLKRHPNDAQLLLVLGRLCAASALWGKAQSYFEASIALQPSAVAHAELGRLFAQLEKIEQANDHYRQGLALLI